jgi:DnaJ family protein C protein 28
MSPKNWESAVDQQIREAQEQGKFDNLPGQGKPLDLKPNPHAQDKELAYRILKNAGHAPEWIELDKAIRGRLDRARKKIETQKEWHQKRTSQWAGRSDKWAEAERSRSLVDWENALVSFGQEIETINKDIADYNLKVPSLQFQRGLVNAEKEIERMQGNLE